MLSIILFYTCFRINKYNNKTTQLLPGYVLPGSSRSLFIGDYLRLVVVIVILPEKREEVSSKWISTILIRATMTLPFWISGEYGD